MKYLLSIVIPTKDRYFYLKRLLSLLVSYNSNEIEIVLQDNTEDNREIVEFLNALKWPHIKYDHTPKQIPISDNSDKAILNSTGEYVCFIGDDDAVLSNICDIVESLKNKHIDACITKTVVYNWPDFKDDSLFHLSASVVYRKGTGTCKEIDSNKELKNALSNGFKNMGCMPRVYQGVVSRAKLDEVYEKYGTYFPGASSDMANAVALCIVGCSCLYIDQPSIISGQSKNVGGGERLMQSIKHISEIPFLPKNLNEHWNNQLPQLWCSDSIWPESAYQTLIDGGCKELAGKINWEVVKARFVFNHKEYKKTVTLGITTYLYMVYILVEKAIKYIGNRLLFVCSNKRYVLAGRINRGITSVQKLPQIIGE